MFGRSDRGRPTVTGVSSGRLDLNVSHHGPLVVLAAVAAAPECGAIEEDENPLGKYRKSPAF